MSTIDASAPDVRQRPQGERIVETLEAAMLRDVPAPQARVDDAVAALRHALVSRDLVMLVEAHGLMVNGDEVGTPSAIRLLHRMAAVRIRRVRIQTTARDEDLAAMLRAVHGTDAEAMLAQLRTQRVTGISIELRDRPMLPAMALPESEAEAEELVANRPADDDTAVLAVADGFAVALDPAIGLGAAAIPAPVAPAPEPERLDPKQQQALALELFVQLLSASNAARRQQLFGRLVELDHCVPFLQKMLSHERSHTVVTAVELLEAKGAGETSGPVAQLMRHRTPAVRVQAARALGTFATPVCWSALQVGLFDSAVEVRIASLQAFDSKPDALPVAVMRSLLARETTEEMLLEIVSRLSRYKSYEVYRPLARATILQIKERGSLLILRAMLEQLLVLQPPIARRLSHYLRGSPNSLRAALGDEIFRRTIGQVREEEDATTDGVMLPDHMLDERETGDPALARIT